MLANRGNRAEKNAASKPCQASATVTDATPDQPTATSPTQPTATSADPAPAPRPAGRRRVANLLDPKVPNTAESKSLPLLIKVYGFLCLADGVLTLPSVAVFFGMTLLAIVHRSSTVALGGDVTLSVSIAVAGIMLSVASSVALIIFGVSLIRDLRRNAALISYVLIAFTVIELLIDVMLQGVSPALIRPAAQLVILIALSATVDPVLRQERELQRRLRNMLDRDAAAEGLLGRDETGEGYIKLNFFNLFWVFMVCSLLGLILETVWHMTIDEPGVYQDRAGVLFGPLSPIYGLGAVIMTMALNRFYKRSPLLIFLVSAVLGGAFEVFVSWFLQTSFGVIAWLYDDVTLFGLPDPIVLLTGARACTQMTALWGLGGLLWIKLCLPRLLKLINLIPWKWRYSLTVVVSALMVVDCFMTLQALDCWYERVSGIEPTSPVEQFYAEHFDNEYMANRFQSMEIHPRTSGRAPVPTAEDVA